MPENHSRGPCPSRTQLIRFLGDELEELAVAALTEHVESCANCQGELDLLSEDFASTHRYPVIPGYQIEGELGRGGMGTVYLAHRSGSEEVVAIKVLPESFANDAERRRRFQLEVEALMRLDHPGIVRIVESGLAGDRSYYAMEYVSGLTLGQFTRGKLLDPKQALQIVEQIAESIAYAHAQRILHRDLKPSNILLSPTQAGGIALGSASEMRAYAVKLVDFSVAKLLDSTQTFTRTGEVLGTLDYMAPEQVLGGEVGPAADIYSCGVLLYELLTGRTPHRASSLPELIEQIRNIEPVSLRALVPTIPRGIESICLKCLEKEPGRRYLDANALADDLKRAIAGRPVLAQPISPLRKLGRWIHRRPVEATLAGSALALLVAGLIASQAFLWQARVANERILAEQTAKERERDAREQAEILQRESSELVLNSVESLEINPARFTYIQNQLPRLEQQVQQAPESKQARKDLVTAYRALCWMSWPNPDIERVSVWYEKGIEQIAELDRLGEEPSYCDWNRGQFFNMWGNVFRYHKDYPQAIEKYEFSIEALERRVPSPEDLFRRHFRNTAANNQILRALLPLYYSSPEGREQVRGKGWTTVESLLLEAEKNVDDSYQIVCRNRSAINRNGLDWLSDDFRLLVSNYLVRGDFDRARELLKNWTDITEGWAFGDVPRLIALSELVGRTRSDEDAFLLADHLDWLRRSRRIQDPEIRDQVAKLEGGTDLFSSSLQEEYIRAQLHPPPTQPVRDLPIVKAALEEVNAVGPRLFPARNSPSDAPKLDESPIKN